MSRLLLLASTVFVLATAATAAERPRLLSIVPNEEKISLTFTKSGDVAVAKVNVLLRNDAARGGRLEVRFFATDRIVAAAAKPEAPSAANPLALALLRPTAVDGEVTVGANDVVPLELEFRRRATDATVVKGNLVIRLAGERPIGPLLVPAEEKQAEAKPLAFAQKSATLVVTRGWGPLTGRVRDCFDRERNPWMMGDDVEIGIRGETPQTADAQLNSDTGGVGRVVFMRLDDKRGVLDVADVDKRGLYSGDLVLDPEAEKPRTLSLTIHVRDFILWPFLAILAGVGLAAWLLKGNELRRGRNLLQKAIQEAVDPYLAARERERRKPAAEQRQYRFYLNHLLPAQGKPYYTGKSCKHPDDLPVVASLYCRAGAATGEGELNELTSEALEVTAEFDRWAKVEQAAQAVYAEIRDLPAASPMRLDADGVLDRTFQPLGDDKEAVALVRVLRTEAAAAVVYRHARALYDPHEPAWKEKRTKLEPNAALAGAVVPDTRTPDDAEKLELSLLSRVRLLRLPNPPEDDHVSNEEVEGKDIVVEAMFGFLPLDERAAFRRARRLPIPIIDIRTPQAIAAEVRRFDWLVFAVSVALTALLYLSQQYKGDYGSLEDYLFAFAAGAVGPIAITWALLPLTRSYRPRRGGAMQTGGGAEDASA